jgi:ArsR family metal-binding transcriptional regulator
MMSGCIRRSRSKRVRVVANMQTSYWRERWHEGLSPRAAYRRHCQCWDRTAWMPMRRADDITRLYLEGLMTGSIIAHDMGASKVAKVLRMQASRACPFGPIPARAMTTAIAAMPMAEGPAPCRTVR